MKHSLRIVVWLLIFFVLSQIIGLFVISNYITIEEVEKIDLITNQTYVVNQTIALDLPHEMERPQFNTSIAFISYLVIAILIATVLFLFLVKLKTNLFTA